MHWYKRDPEKALNGMAELTLEERGAYNSLIDLLYSRNGEVPDDDVKVSKMIRCHWRQWAAVKRRLMDHGKVWVEGGKLMAKSVQKTLTEAADFSHNQGIRAAHGWQERKKLNKNNASGMPPGNANTTTTTTTTTTMPPPTEVAAPSSEAAPRQPLLVSVESPKKQPKASRIPEDWKPNSTLIAFALELGIDWQLASAEFLDYWLAASGRTAVKRDWDRTFKNRCRELQHRGRFLAKASAQQTDAAEMLRRTHEAHFARTGQWNPDWGPEPRAAAQ